MNSIRTLVASVVGTDSSLKQSARPDVRRAPVCESLEGRQLLSVGVSGSPWAGAHHWDALTATGTTGAAQVQPWNGVKDTSDHHHFLGFGAGFSAKGGQGNDLPPLSAKAKADLNTLQSDVSTFRSEVQSKVPAALQAQIKTDRTTIKNALATLTPQQLQAAFPAPSTQPTTRPNPTTILTNVLKEANVSAATIDQITSDFQTYKSTLETVDPTLSAKIKADREALAQDLPAPAGHFGPIAGAPGLPAGHVFPF